MIRINRLLRTSNLINKLPLRAGPGWDRPDVPPTQRVQTDRRWTHNQIIYTFFDSSMPEFFITEPQIYVGDLVEGLPQLASLWSLLFGTAFALFVFNQLVNPKRSVPVLQPVEAQYFMSQIKRLQDDRLAVKYTRQNPFGITVNPEMYPYENNGKYYYPGKYYSIKASLEKIETINRQAQQYLKAAMQRASKPQTKNDQSHHH